METPEHSIALEAYEELAESYAALAETKPHNAYYDRPAVFSLLPDVGGMNVLDAGCGPGIYTESLLKRGAKVVGVDISPKMVRMARKRLGGNTAIYEADLSKPMPFLRDESFDLVLSPLVLSYIRDLRPVFAEFYRVLRKPGWLIFSTGHPFFEFTYFKSQNYFETEFVGTNWYGFGRPVYMPSYRRPLSAEINPLIEAGFVMDHVLEPLPTEAFKEADPKEYEKLIRRPIFICFRARK